MMWSRSVPEPRRPYDLLVSLMKSHILNGLYHIIWYAGGIVVVKGRYNGRDSYLQSYNPFPPSIFIRRLRPISKMTNFVSFSGYTELVYR